MAMISRRDAFLTWFRIGILSFGGPAGQIALMHKVLVEEKHWLDETRFVHALNYCMLLPGPEAMQLATYIGWLLHKTWGGVVAGLLFVLPGFFVMLALSITYALFHTVPLISAVFFGVKCAVLVIVVEALIRIGKRSLRNPLMAALAVLSFIAIFFFNIPFPLVIIAAAAAGLLGNRLAPQLFKAKEREITADKEKSIVDKMAEAGLLTHTAPDKTRTAVVTSIWLLIWLLPVAALLAMDTGGMLAQLAVFFSKMAVVTFGGAYAVLTYVAQEVVLNFKWLSSEDMMNGLGLAETTPGPLILVLEYTGFMAAYKQGGMMAGIAGAVVATWVTFAPCFLWIFAGAPYVEKIRGNVSLAAALSAITAAVTGVILNLAVWFGMLVMVDKSGQPDLYALGIAAVAAAMTFWLKRNMLETLGVCALLSVTISLLPTP